MEIFGKKLDKNEILEKIGDIAQVSETKQYKFTDKLLKSSEESIYVVQLIYK